MTGDSAPPPIEPTIVADHLLRAARALAKEDADGLLLFRKSNILAFCGVPMGPSDRLVCGLVNRDGRVAFVVPAFEADVVPTLPAGTHLVTWEEHEDPYAAVANAAGLLGVATGKVLLDPMTWLEAQDRLSAAMPRATLAIDPGVLAGIRSIKTADEIEAVRAACVDTGRVFPLIAQLLAEGLTEQELARTALCQLREAGLSPIGELIQGGPNASIPHRPTGQRPFESGDAVIVDLVCRRRGYHGDMTRTFALGTPADEVKRAYAVVRDAHRAAIDAIRPGITCGDLDAVARSIIEAAGLGKWFVHRLGHGIGLDIHEPPFLVRGNDRPLEPGMCVTIEPGVYVHGKFGIRIEDVVAVTADAGEVLSSDTPTDVSDFG